MIECESTLIYLQKKTMTFLNINYVFHFIVNIITNNIFVNKNLHFDTIYNYFYRNNIFVVFVFCVKTHYVLKNNKIFEKMNIFTIIVRNNLTTK